MAVATAQRAPNHWRERTLSAAPWAVLALWLTLVTAQAALLAQGSSLRVVPPCFFRSATGIPCATCGGTRMAAAAMRGDVFEAFLWNPMLFLALPAGAAFLALRVFLRRRGIAWSARLRAATWATLAAAFALHWAWVIVRDAQ